MPPRLRNSRLSSTLPSSAASTSCPVPSSSSRCKCLRNTFSERSFRSNPISSTRLRREMFTWLNSSGKAFKHPLPGSTNYLSAYDRRGQLLRTMLDSVETPNVPETPTPQEGDEQENSEQGVSDARDARGKVENTGPSNSTGEQRIPKETSFDLKPFPHNTAFTSQSVLSEELRNQIWERVKVRGKSVRAVSAELGVEMRRVGAVVRLVELEKRWVQEGKSLARPYAKAVLAMLPTTPYTTPRTPHETINDLPVHPLTGPQIFHPTSESRAFNRVDAGRVFSAAPALTTSDSTDGKKTELVGKNSRYKAVEEVLKPADERIPHPHLIAFDRDRLDPKLANDLATRTARHAERLKAEEDEIAERKQKDAGKEQTEVKSIVEEGRRWEFRFRDVAVTVHGDGGIGTDGRGRGVGKRYGVPSYERKRGRTKIPTRVEV